MTVTTTILTFAAGAQPFPAGPGIGLVRRVSAQPLRSNTHVCSVGTAAVTNDGSGAGVVQELALPAVNVPLDLFLLEDQNGDNRIDPTLFYAQGTVGEKITVSYIGA